ncbi:MAG TPA: sulfotransferase domain-containing protein [Candidatus Kryptonia bacterium]|nr:sulfotransferase domain-containing protein [Candidatus Kryptonia bacterium]
MDHETITVVSGLPRSGTSMMMKMLEAGGLAVLTDNLRTADEDNPKGYFEFERVKKLAQDQSWLSEAKGKVVKVISALLRHLPATYRYRVVFMQREMAEVLASQRQMLVRRGQPADGDDAKMADAFRRHLGDVEKWLAQQSNMPTLFISYNAILQHPAEETARLNQFFDNALDAAAMMEVVDRALHRQRREERERL